MTVVGRSVKRTMDLAAACLGVCILCCLAVFALLALLIMMDSSGPIIYRRRVLGCGGRQFDAFKFRTMIANAEEFLVSRPDLWAEYQSNVKLRSDPRITRVGHWLRKSSLDELPQLFNVLRGEMSLVGPRMVTSAELERYVPLASKLLTVRPGITGLWQVTGRQDVSYQTRVRIDMDYIDNWSLLLDLKILLKTIPAVLGMRGAY